MTPLEDKIRTKVINCFMGYKNRCMGGSTEQNENQYFTDITLAMMKMIKVEVNIRLQEERHRKDSK